MRIEGTGPRGRAAQTTRAGLRRATALVLGVLTAAMPAAAVAQRAPDAPLHPAPRLPAADYACAYRAAGEPLMVVADVLDNPTGRSDNVYETVANQFMTLLRGHLQQPAGGAGVRMLGAAESDRFRLDTEAIRRARISLGAAGGYIAERLNAELVVVVRLNPTPSAGSVAEMSIGYEVLDTTFANPRLIASNAGRLRFRINDSADMLEDSRDQAWQTAMDIMRGMVDRYGGCEPREPTPERAERDRAPAAPGNDRRPAERPEVAGGSEFTITVTGQIDDWEIGPIRDTLARMPSVVRLLGDPVVDNRVDELEQQFRRTRVSFDVLGRSGGFDVSQDFAVAFLIATGKDVRIVSSRQRDLVMEVRDPIHSVWLGPQSPANRGAREALRNAYEMRGAPPVLVLIDEIVGRDYRTERLVQDRHWRWWHGLDDRERPIWEDVGNQRAFAAGAITTGIIDAFGQLGIDVIDDLDGVASDMREAGLIVEGAEGPTVEELRRFARGRYGVELVITGRGEISRRADRATMAFSFRGAQPGTRRTLVSTQTAARELPFEDLLSGRPTNEIARELAAQIIDDLARAWTGSRSRMQVVITDALGQEDQQVIRAALEGVEGVGYVAFRSLGESALVLEVTHAAAGDAIREAIAGIDSPFRVQLEPGTTQNRLLARIVGRVNVP